MAMDREQPATTVPATADGKPGGNGVGVAPEGRWYQFSLRTLIVMTIAVSVLLGLFAARLQRARKQAAAVAVIRKFGGAISYHDGIENYPDYPVSLGSKTPASIFPTWAVESLGDDFFHTVMVVEVDTRKIEAATDAICVWESVHALDRVVDLTISERDGPSRLDVSAIRRLSNLQSLEIADSAINDDDLAGLAELINLRHLSLLLTSIDGRGFEHLAALSRLESVSVSGSIAVSDDGVKQICKRRRLRYLGLESTSVTDTAIQFICVCHQSKT